jgi:hypothetical protein
VGALDRLRADARRSVVGAGMARARLSVNGLSSRERVRLAGVFVLTTTATNVVLLQWSPAVARPMASVSWGLASAAAGLTMVLFAAPLARAWTSSKVRRLFRAPESHGQNGARA